MADPEDGLNGAPWYVRFLVRVGVPTAFASVLLWFLLSNVTGDLAVLATTQLDIIKNQVTIMETQARVVQLQIDHQDTDATMIQVLQALCFNSAENQTARDRCAIAFTAGR